MRSTLWRLATACVGAMLLGALAWAQPYSTASDLMPFLQSEENEVATLNAQVAYLQQQGDPLGAAVIASYIPDHQAQISRLSDAIQARGGTPQTIQPNINPAVGDLATVVAQDLQAHQLAIDNYRKMSRRTGDANLRLLADLGSGIAITHFNSLTLAQAATLKTPVAMNNGILAALALEQSAVADLQAQATQLTALGDQNGAGMLQTAMQSHQQQVSQLTAVANQLGLATNRLLLPTPVALAARPDILQHARVFNTLLVNTYALEISVLPPSPLQQAMVGAQQVALLSLSQLQQLA